MGFKGSPGFMAPEILKYVGTEACTEKVDIYSYAMFLFETISLHFPFEKQNLMHAQIEKLVIDGERPPLQNRVSQPAEQGEGVSEPLQNRLSESVSE